MKYRTISDVNKAVPGCLCAHLPAAICLSDGPSRAGAHIQPVEPLAAEAQHSRVYIGAHQPTPGRRRDPLAPTHETNFSLLLSSFVILSSSTTTSTSTSSSSVSVFSVSFPVLICSSLLVSFVYTLICWSDIYTPKHKKERLSIYPGVFVDSLRWTIGNQTFLQLA